MSTVASAVAVPAAAPGAGLDLRSAAAPLAAGGGGAGAVVDGDNANGAPLSAILNTASATVVDKAWPPIIRDDAPATANAGAAAATAANVGAAKVPKDAAKGKGRGEKRGPNYGDAENLITVLAALEANETQQDQSDEMKWAEAIAAFKRWCKQFCIKEVAAKYNLEPILPSDVPTMIYWRTKESGLIHTRFQHMKRECNNMIVSLWKKLLDPSGALPSGQQIEGLIIKLRHSLWCHEHPAADHEKPVPAKYNPHTLQCFIAFGPPAAYFGRDVVPCFAGDGLSLQSAAAPTDTSRSGARTAKKAKLEHKTEATAENLAVAAGTGSAISFTSPSASPKVTCMHSPCSNTMCQFCWWPPGFTYRPDLMLPPSPSNWGGNPWPYM